MKELRISDRVWFIWGDFRTLYRGQIRKLEEDGNGITYTIIAEENTEFPVKAAQIYRTKLDAVNARYKETCGFRKWSLGVGQFGVVRVEFNHYPNQGEIVLFDASPDELKKIGKMFLDVAEDLEFLGDVKNLDE